MRKRVLALALAALPGCQLQLPNGFVLPTPAATTPAPAVAAATAAPPVAAPAMPVTPAMKPGAKMAEGDLAGGAMLAAGAPPMGGAMGPPPGGCDTAFAALDADGDGGLTLAELVRWRAIEADPGYQAAVPACDGPPTPAPAPTDAPEAPAGPDDGPSEPAEDLDDGQAWLVSNEAGATPIPRPSDAFPPDACGDARPMKDPAEALAKVDWNHDGRLDPEEFCAFGALWLAPPGGPVLIPTPPPTDGPRPTPPPTTEPAPTAPPPTEPPPGGCPDDAADRNQDGFVDWGEYFEAHHHEADVMAVDYAVAKEAVYKRFQGLDRNGDQMLDARERCAR